MIDTTKLTIRTQGSNNWEDFNPEALNIGTPKYKNLKRVKRRYRRFIRRFLKQGTTTIQMRWPTTQDDLVLEMMVFPHNHEN